MHHHWRYPNLALLLASLSVTAFLALNGTLFRLVEALGALGYLGVFLAGTLFVSTFTLAPAAVVLFNFAKVIDPAVIAVIGGLGAALGDYIAYRFIRERLFDELSPLLKTLHLYRRVNVLHTRYFAWLAPVVGAAIIASPLPDELGLSLLGLKKISLPRFLLLAFLLNALGIYVVALAAGR